MRRVARSAFGFAGQKCSACSRVYVEEPVYDEFVTRLAKRAAELVVARLSGGAGPAGPVDLGFEVVRRDSA